MTNQEYVELISNELAVVLKQSIKKYIVSKIPSLAGFLNPIISMFAGKLALFLISQAEISIFFAHIDMRTSAEGREYTKAVYEHSKNPTAESERILNEAFKRLVTLTS